MREAERVSMHRQIYINKKKSRGSVDKPMETNLLVHIINHLKVI